MPRCGSARRLGVHEPRPRTRRPGSDGKQPRSKAGAETYENLLWGHKYLSRPFRLGSEAGIVRLQAVGLDESATCSVTVEHQTRHLVAEYEPALEGLSFTRRNNQSGFEHGESMSNRAGHCGGLSRPRWHGQDTHHKG